MGVPAGASAATCPVAWLRRWLAVAGIDDGPIFRMVDAYGNVRDGRLSAQSVCLIVKRHAERVGFSVAYSAHSLRAGLATSAASGGAATLRIADHGCDVSRRSRDCHRPSTPGGHAQDPPACGLDRRAPLGRRFSRRWLRSGTWGRGIGFVLPQEFDLSHYAKQQDHADDEQAKHAPPVAIPRAVLAAAPTACMCRALVPGSAILGGRSGSHVRGGRQMRVNIHTIPRR